MPANLTIDTDAIRRAGARLASAATYQAAVTGGPVDDSLYADTTAGPNAVGSALVLARNRAEEGRSAIAGLARAGDDAAQELATIAHEFDQIEQLCGQPG